MTGFKRLRASLATLGIAATVMVLAGSTTALAQPTSWDAALDFSATSNPTGAWSYGWSASRGSTFNLSLAPTTLSGLDAWQYSSTHFEPGVIHNATSSTILFWTSPIPAGSLAFHPGPSGQNAIVRWTAPSAGSYMVAATFTGRDQYGPTSTDVAVLSNGGQLWAGEVTGYLATQNFTSGLLKLNAGDTIDFTVGYGTDLNYYYDTTGLSARISIPTTPPVVSITTPAQGATYTLNQSVIAAYLCTSPDFAAVACVGTVLNGSPIDTASTGLKTFTGVATDPANNMTSASVTYSVTYGICWLYDSTKAVRSGATIPIRVALCDSRGLDLSSPSITVSAVALTQLATGAHVTLESGDSPNPGNKFRFDAGLSTNGGYIFNLETERLTAGAYALSLSVSGDPILHTAQFTVINDHGSQAGTTAPVKPDDGSKDGHDDAGSRTARIAILG